ncbi:hypothetical protein GA0061081_1222 [Gilliamella bombicola]|uniref:Uncharacterized protein n=1 Tax=Gilliamella bombicola TaxID=1798182 RepID=A0A1C4DRG0_9GAMM|nr:hypothetical protein GA0061081_1222 [Gilliamella bombicola]
MQKLMQVHLLNAYFVYKKINTLQNSLVLEICLFILKGLSQKDLYIPHGLWCLEE